MTHRIDRTLLLERDPEKLGKPQLNSIRDADWRHQSVAMTQGYNSIAEQAIDELIGLVRDLYDRVERLEGELGIALPENAA